MKKILIGIGIAIITAAIVLFVIFQRYIYHYNRGNAFYEEQLYEKAIIEYEKALKCHVMHRKECDIRVNIALAKIAPLDLEHLEQLSEDEKKEYIVIIEEAIDVLVTEDCAHRNDENGHDEEAQKLKDELQEILDQLQNNQDQQSQADDSQQEPQQSQIEESQPTDQQQQLEEIMQQGTDEYMTGTDHSDQMVDFDYYDGNCW